MFNFLKIRDIYPHNKVLYILSIFTIKGLA